MTRLSEPQKACLRAAMVHSNLSPDRHAAVYVTPDGSRFRRVTVSALLRLKYLRKTRDGRSRELTDSGRSKIRITDFHI